MARRRHAGGMLLALCALGLAISPSQLEIRGSYPILQDVFVNGKGPYRMLLDTGAQSSSVRPGVAAETNLLPKFAVELRNTLGSSIASVASAGQIASGGMTIQELEVLITEPPPIPGAGKLDGVIGQSFLARTNYWVDFAKKRVRWDPDGVLHGCLAGERLNFVLVEGRPAVEVRFRTEFRAAPQSDLRAHGGTRSTLVLDSGASHLILFGWRDPANAAAPGLLRTAQQQGTARVIRVESVAVGGLIWRGLTAGAVATEDSGAGGLFPAHLLKSFYINNREQYVLAAPRVSERCASGPTGPLAHTGAPVEKAW